jgi:hypothetical protein
MENAAREGDDPERCCTSGRLWEEPTVVIAVRRMALDETILYPSCKRTWLKTTVRAAPNESDGESSAKIRGSYLIGENRRRLSRSGGRRLMKRCYPSCKRMWLKTAVRRILARNHTAERIDETDFFERNRTTICIYELVAGFWSPSESVRYLNLFGSKAQDHQSASESAGT